MITSITDLDSVMVGVLRRAAVGRLSYRRTTSRYLWDAHTDTPHAATVTETSAITTLLACSVLREAGVPFTLGVAIEPTALGDRMLVRSKPPDDTPPVVANYGAPYSVTAALNGADAWVAHALQLLARQPGASADVRNKLLTAKELISEARIDLGGS